MTPTKNLATPLSLGMATMRHPSVPISSCGIKKFPLEAKRHSNVCAKIRIRFRKEKIYLSRMAYPELAGKC
jgi:hypothetical protein